MESLRLGLSNEYTHHYTIPPSGMTLMATNKSLAKNGLFSNPSFFLQISPNFWTKFDTPLKMTDKDTNIVLRL